MSKKIIIEAEDAEVKKVEKNIHKYSYHHLVDNKVVEWLIYMIGYAIVLITVSKLFQSFTINTSHFGIYAFLAAIIIYILNQTVKPLINYITIPLTIITWGMLYPLSNVIILYIKSIKHSIGIPAADFSQKNAKAQIVPSRLLHSFWI